MATGNLFSKAKKAAPVTKAAKDKKIRLQVTDPPFFSKVEKLEQLNDTLKSAKAQADMISDEIKDLAKSEWVDYYSQTGKNPESVMIVQEVAGDTAQVMFIPTDKYITVTEARAEELRETYGEEIVEEETTFSFDSTMIEKYGEVLSMLIENCADITDADKEKIIKATTKYSVAKGTIDKLNQYGDVQEVMEAVKPVVALKNVEVIKG
jgi:predicted house-cleaning noncanonical NTP pyrophosphatase (MazG superfamily)